jgi:hypothetical protein
MLRSMNVIPEIMPRERLIAYLETLVKQLQNAEPSESDNYQLTINITHADHLDCLK